VLKKVPSQAALAIGLDVVAFDGQHDLPLIAASADAVRSRPPASISFSAAACSNTWNSAQEAFNEWRRLLRAPAAACSS
jgi:hypothetical protein